MAVRGSSDKHSRVHRVRERRLDADERVCWQLRRRELRELVRGDALVTGTMVASSKPERALVAGVDFPDCGNKISSATDAAPTVFAALVCLVVIVFY